MGVRKEEYIIIGCKFERKFTQEIWNRKDREELDSKYDWEEEREEEIQYITDGMSGEYTFFGFIKQLTNGWEDRNTEIIEFQEPTIEQKEQIAQKFLEIFPGKEMTKITMYYLPHYI